MVEEKFTANVAEHKTRKAGTAMIHMYDLLKQIADIYYAENYMHYKDTEKMFRNTLGDIYETIA